MTQLPALLPTQCGPAPKRACAALLSCALSFTALLPAALLPVILTGCAAGSGATGPREGLRAYALALRERRVSDAYALLGQDARARVPFAEFSRMVAENGREIEDISASLLEPSEPPEITATLSSRDGERLLLVYEGDAWRVDGSAFDLYGQATPRAALESFVRAFDNKRYDVLLRFVPEAKRQGLNEEQLKKAWEGDQRQQVERVTQALKASLPNLRIEVLGTRATVAYGPGGSVELVQEQGAWRIEDF
jgi:hypothetical protein